VQRADGYRHDAVIRAGDVTHIVEVKAQSTVNAATARNLIDYARHLPGHSHLLIVARTTTKDARLILEKAGVALMDAGGNMRVNLPGMFLWTDGRRAPASPENRRDAPAKLTGKAGVAAQALLLEPERRWGVHDLASVCSISTGLAHRVLARLERENLIEVHGSGPNRTREVSHPGALLDLWAEEMRDRKVTQVRAFRLARDARSHTSRLSSLLAEADIDHAVSGSAGATLLAPFVTAVPVVDIWVTNAVPIEDAAEAVEAEPVIEGHNILLRQEPGDTPLVFRSMVKDIWMVNRFRLYLDLRRSSRRGPEQAERVREEVIGF
jgi:hypothetical protein